MNSNENKEFPEKLYNEEEKNEHSTFQNVNWTQDDHYLNRKSM